MWRFTPNRRHDFKDLLSWGKAVPQAFPGAWSGGAKMGQPGMQVDWGLAGFVPTGTGRVKRTGQEAEALEVHSGGGSGSRPRGAILGGPGKQVELKTSRCLSSGRWLRGSLCPPQDKGEE